MSSYLTHLRFVHNLQTTICLAIIYLVWSSWTSGTELLAELNRLFRTTALAREAVESHGHLSYLIPDIPSSRNSLGTEIAEMTGLNVSVSAPSMARSLTSPPDEWAPIGVQWDQLQEQEWLLTTLGLSEDSLREVSAWLDERWRPCLRYLSATLDRRNRRDPRARRRYRALSSRDRLRLTTPEVYFTVTDWPESADTVSALVEVMVYVPQRDGTIHDCRKVGNNVSDAGELTPDDDLGLFVERKTFGIQRLITQPISVRIPRTAFDDYRHLEWELDGIADLTPTAALEWARDQQVAGIQGRESRLLGTNIRGEHLGYVAPWAILLLHAYLLVNLYGLRGQVQNGLQATTVVSWLAAIKQPFPRLFSFLTLVALPVVAAVFALWRLTPTSRIGLSVWMLVLLVSGVGAIVLAQSLDGRGDANPRDVNREIRQRLE